MGAMVILVRVRLNFEKEINMNIILASQSPRRLELMRFLTNDFLVVPSDFPERDVEYQGDPQAYCKELALKKALAVAEDYPNDVVIGSDTIVYFNDEIMNKPIDRADAKAMIRKMQGNVHEVLTAYAIVNQNKGIEVVGVESTKVRFSEISKEEIETYLLQEDYMGKAGAYAIQGAAAKFVEAIEGDFYTVVGLPVAKLYRELKGLNIL